MSKYNIKGYYGKDYRGLADSDETNDFSKAIDIVHHYCCKGDYVIFDNSIKTLWIDPDTWLQSIDEGDVMEEIKAMY